MNIKYHIPVVYNLILFQFFFNCNVSEVKNCLKKPKRLFGFSYPKKFHLSNRYKNLYRNQNHNFCKNLNIKFSNSHTVYRSFFDIRKLNNLNNHTNFWKYITISTCGVIISAKNQKNNIVYAKIEVCSYHSRCPNCKYPIKISKDIFETSDYRDFIVYAIFQCPEFFCNSYFAVKNPNYTRGKSFLSNIPFIGSTLELIPNIYESYQENDCKYVARSISDSLVPVLPNYINEFDKISKNLRLAQQQRYMIRLNWIIEQLKISYPSEDTVFTWGIIIDILEGRAYFYDSIVDKYKKTYKTDLTKQEKTMDKECIEFINDRLDDAFCLYSHNYKLTLNELERVVNKINDTKFLKSIPHDGIFTI